MYHCYFTIKANADRAKAKNISLGMGRLIGIHTILCIFLTFAFAPMGPGAIHPYVTYLFINIFFAFARSALTLALAVTHIDRHVP